MAKVLTGFGLIVLLALPETLSLGSSPSTSQKSWLSHSQSSDRAHVDVVEPVEAGDETEEDFAGLDMVGLQNVETLALAAASVSACPALAVPHGARCQALWCGAIQERGPPGRS